MTPQIGEIQPRRMGAEFVEAISRAETDIQIATAKAYPRVISKSIETAIELATLDEETAASCFYSIPRDGKVITGPSVRLAEIVAYSWKNLRIATRIVDEGDTYIVAQAVCHDLENNVALSRDVRSKIQTKDKRRYSEDMITTTANATCSKAMRDVIFDVIPLAVIRPVVEAVGKVSVGDEKTLGTKRVAMMQHFGKLGVSEARILAAIKKRTIEDVTLEDMLKLRGFATAIKDGEATADTIFPDPSKKPESTVDKLKAKAAELKTEAPVDDAPVPVPAIDVAHWTTLGDALTSGKVGDGFNFVVDHVENTSYAKHHRFKVKDGEHKEYVYLPANGPLHDNLMAAARLKFAGAITEERGERKLVADSVEVAP